MTQIFKTHTRQRSPAEGKANQTNPNRQIKAMLTQAALAAVNFNPQIAAYYVRLIKAGKKKQVALNNVKNKLVHLVTAMV